MLSIVTPTLDAAKFLPNCLEAVARLPFEHEHIVVDGGSADETVALATAAGARVLRQTRADGMYGAVDEGLQASRGAYVTYVNADDEPVADGYAALYSRICAADAPTLTYGSCLYRYVAPGSPQRDRVEPSRKAAAYFLRAGILPFAQPSCVFRRDAYEAVGGFDASNYRIAGDLEFFRRMAMLPDFRAVAVPTVASIFLKHGESLGDRNTPLAEEERRRMGVPTHPRLMDQVLFRIASWV